MTEDDQRPPPDHPSGDVADTELRAALGTASNIPPRQSGNPSGCASVLMILAGLVLLLPGICSWYFVQAGMPNDLASIGLFVGGIGFVMIIAGIVLLTQRRRIRL
jgi:hypothetical protein